MSLVVEGESLADKIQANPGPVQAGCCSRVLTQSPVQGFCQLRSVWLLSLCGPAEWLRDGCADNGAEDGEAKGRALTKPH